MPRKETKHAAFLRLTEKRLLSAQNQMRLIRQMSSDNYENTPEEAVTVIDFLDKEVRAIAQVFGVEYVTRIGSSRAKAAADTNTTPAIGISAKTAVIDAADAMRLVDMIEDNELEDAKSLLRSAIVNPKAA
jgi:hypothetical protein